ncbi:MAG: hypothetical protein IJU61_00350 [Victivallales bacterium]|nr:hypothetical protein [Victivallales bacterium]
MSYKSRLRYAKYCKVEKPVVFGERMTTNYKEFEMNANYWKQKLSINAKRAEIALFEIKDKKGAEKFIDMLKSLCKTISRFNNAKSTETWQCIKMNDDEKYMYDCLFDFVQTCNLAQHDGIRRLANEKYADRMIGYYNRLVAKIGKEEKTEEREEKTA